MPSPAQRTQDPRSERGKHPGLRHDLGRTSSFNVCCPAQPLGSFSPGAKSVKVVAAVLKALSGSGSGVMDSRYRAAQLAATPNPAAGQLSDGSSQPTVTEFSPSMGDAGGDTTVTITGTGLSNAKVYFGVKPGKIMRKWHDDRRHYSHCTAWRGHCASHDCDSRRDGGHVIRRHIKKPADQRLSTGFKKSGKRDSNPRHPAWEFACRLAPPLVDSSGLATVAIVSIRLARLMPGYQHFARAQYV